MVWIPKAVGAFKRSKPVRKKRASQKKKWLRVALLVLLAIVVGVAAAYVYYGNALSSALATSLGAFRVVSVTYPIVTPDLVEVNITLALDNTSEFPIAVEAITISFFINDKGIGEISVPLDETVSAGNSHHFYSIQNVTDASVLKSIRESTYVLKINGEIRGTASFLFVQASANKRLNFSKLVEGLHEPSLK
jgi:LEA14-like dessication related protein